MDCRDCPRFDKEAARCQDGKVNPATYNDAFQVAQYLGLRSICTFNDHRERLVASRRGGAVRTRG